MKAAHYKEEHMARVRLIVAVLSGVAVLAGAVPLAHAGGGPGQGLAPGPTACRIRQGGGNPRQVLNVIDPLTDPVEGENVNVNPPALLCNLEAVAEVVRGPALTEGFTPNFVACYHVAGPGRANFPATLTDPFGTRDVRVTGLKFLCVPAQLEE